MVGSVHVQMNPSMFQMPRVVLITTMIAASWFLMQGVHESGHVLTGLTTGGKIACVVLHPLTISRTDFQENPNPLLTCWGGPLLGVLLPLLIWAISATMNCRCSAWLRFFAGFCLIANGSYLTVGVKDGIGDAGDLIRHGSSAWMLFLFGAVTIPTGLWLWNGLGKEFGIGSEAAPVTWKAAAVSTLVLLTALTIAILVGGS